MSEIDFAHGPIFPLLEPLLPNSARRASQFPETIIMSFFSRGQSDKESKAGKKKKKKYVSFFFFGELRENKH